MLQDLSQRKAPIPAHGSGGSPPPVPEVAILLSIESIEDLFRGRVILFEHLGTPGYLAEADVVFLGDAPLGMAFVKLFEKLPSKDEVTDLLGGKYLPEKGDHLLVIGDHGKDLFNLVA